MTVDELNYYFDVSDPADVPEYEVVTLSDPARQPDCTFYAFGRSVPKSSVGVKKTFFVSPLFPQTTRSFRHERRSEAVTNYTFETRTLSALFF